MIQVKFVLKLTWPNLYSVNKFLHIEKLKKFSQE